MRDFDGSGGGEADADMGRERRTPALVVAVFAVWAATAGAVGAAEPSACPPSSGQAVWVERVITGDEVEFVDGRRLRLSGIAVARAPLGAEGADWRAAGRASEAAARSALAELVEGRETRFVDLGEDRHGRRRGHLVDTESGHWIQAELLRAGQVRVDSVGERGSCSRELSRFEADARAARRGIWGSGLLGVRAALDPRLDEAVGATVVVEGRVRSLGRSGGRTYLNFGDDFRRDFAVVLDDNHREALVAAGFDPDRSRGRDVRVRGIVVRREGLRIEVAAPEDIEWAKR